MWRICRRNEAEPLFDFDTAIFKFTSFVIASDHHCYDGEMIGLPSPHHPRIDALEILGIENVIVAAAQGDEADAPFPGIGAAVELPQGISKAMLAQPNDCLARIVLVEVADDERGC